MNQPLSAGLVKLGFSLGAPKVTHRRLICAVDGLEKCGKTHFALSAPHPMVYFDVDIGTEGVIDTIQRPDFYYKHIELDVPTNAPQGHIQEKALKLWKEFRTMYDGAIAIKPRTIVVDTATEAYDILRLAAFGKLTQVKAHHYGPVNAEFRDLIRTAYDSEVNLILIHRLKPEYVDDKATGALRRAGFGETGFMVQVNATLSKDIKLRTEDKFKMLVTDCRQNTMLEGEVFEGGMVSFPMLAMSVFPDSDPGDWS